jgi:hypothetical protein
MAQPVYNEHPLRQYLDRELCRASPPHAPGLIRVGYIGSGEDESMPGGLHELDEEDDGHEDEDEAHDDRDRTRRKTSGFDTSAATLAVLSGLSALLGRRSLATTLALEASYPHLRAAVARHAHDLQHPRPKGHDDYVDPSERFTFNSLAASFDRHQASEWFEGCCLAACVSIILQQHDLSGLLLAISRYHSSCTCFYLLTIQ